MSYKQLRNAIAMAMKLSKHYLSINDLDSFDKQQERIKHFVAKINAL